MFVRRKKNRSVTTSIVVVDKSRGRFRELKTISVSASQADLDSIEQKARHWIDEYSGQQTIDFDESESVLMELESTISHIERTLQNARAHARGDVLSKSGWKALPLRENSFYDEEDTFISVICIHCPSGNSKTA